MKPVYVPRVLESINLHNSAHLFAKMCTALVLDLDESKPQKVTRPALPRRSLAASIGPHLPLSVLSWLISSRAKLCSIKVNDTNAWASDIEF